MSVVHVVVDLSVCLVREREEMKGGGYGFAKMVFRVLLLWLIVCLEEGVGSPAVTQAVLSAKADVIGGVRGKGKTAVTIEEPDWMVYHKTEDLLEELREIVAQCDHARVDVAGVQGEDSVAERTLMVVILGFGVKSKIREMVSSALHQKLPIVAMFGEHGRELISSEAALRVVKLVCKDQTAAGDAAREELRRTELYIVPAVGASSRKLAEMGEKCERLNANGVDLNRNYGFLWGKSDSTTEVNEERPGLSPFSEFETQAMKGLIERVRPTAFVTIHSGDDAILMPWDHRNEMPDEDSARRLHIVASAVAEQHCSKCKIGNVYNLFGYNAFGTSVDWVFGSAHVPFAFTWEIYGDPDTHVDDCFRMFNPIDSETYENVVDNWSRAIFTFASAVHTATDNENILHTFPDPLIQKDTHKARTSTPDRRGGSASEFRRRGQGGIELRLASQPVWSIVLEMLASISAVCLFIAAALFVRTKITKQPHRSAAATLKIA